MKNKPIEFDYRHLPGNLNTASGRVIEPYIFVAGIRALFALCVLTLIFIAFTSPYVGPNVLQTYWTIEGALIIFGSMGFVGALIVFLTDPFPKLTSKAQDKLRQFAESNFMTFSDALPAHDENGMLFQTDKTPENVIQYSKNGLQLEMGTIVAPYRRAFVRTTQPYTYLRLPISEIFPHVVLESERNNTLNLDTVPQGISRKNSLSLEGDFDHFFSLYAPEDMKANALYIFTPDIMALLIDDEHAFDLEIVGDSLYLYTPGLVIAERSVIARFVDFVNTIGQKIELKSNRARGAIDAEANIEKSQKARLSNPRMLWVYEALFYLVVVIAIAVVVYLFAANPR